MADGSVVEGRVIFLIKGEMGMGGGITEFHGGCCFTI